MDTITESRIQRAWERVAFLAYHWTRDPQRVPLRLVQAAYQTAIRLEAEKEPA